jgi:hypothetical protein
VCGSVRRLFYPLFIEEEEEEVFFLSHFSSLVFRLLFVRLCIVVRGGVICVACIIILYSRTDAIHFKRYY